MENSIIQEGISKDLQIKILEEKLAFTQRQLEEKDKQLEHYKGLVKTMQQLLERGSGSNHPKATFDLENTGIGKPAFPPGFESKFSIKGRKIHSFHDTTHSRLEEDIYGPTTFSNHNLDIEDEDDYYEEYEREIQRRQLLEQEERDFAKNSNSLKKSKSHTSLSQITNDDKYSPPHHLRASTSSLPNLPKKSPSSTTPQKSESNEWTTKSKLKKSQSMTSVYSALEENRLDLKFPDLDQMVGQIYQLSKYQQGCRFLQKKLEEDQVKNTPLILKELFEHLLELMTDPFGNYLFTKLVERCDAQQRESVIQKILTDIPAAAFDMYGTQSMQKIMPLLTESQIEAVVNALKPTALALIKHNKANYLIQYCLDKLSPAHNQWIYDAVMSNMEEISRDRVGCVIVKRCIDHANDHQRITTLLDKVRQHTIALVQDPFGNYVVQHVLQKYPLHDLSGGVIRAMLGHIVDLCTQKFSSNVVEKCLKVADEDTKRGMLTEIIETELLPQLLNDRFANFVIQTALDVADPETRTKLVKNILPHLGKHYSPYTKRLQKKILQV